MSTQQPSQAWDDGIDLRAYTDTLRRHKWLVLVLVVVAVAVAAILSYVVLPPKYESSVVVSLPAATVEAGLGMNPRSYEEFATSNLVVARVKEKLGLQATSSQLPGRYDVELEESTRLLTVTASAQTAGKAFQLASLWIDAFSQETLALSQAQLAGQKAVAERAVESYLAEVTKAEDALATFDQENPISLMEARLSGMEGVLVSREGQLRDLTLFSIPIDEARLAFLQNALDEEPETLSGSPGTVILPEENPGAGVTSSDVTILNPVYLQLSQDLMATRTRFATSQREVEILEERISSLQEEVDQLRGEIVSSKTDRERLDRQVKEAQARYELARAELDQLLETERRLPELSRPLVVSEPVRAEAPVAPRKALNMAVTGILAALLGVLIAFFLEWYRDERPATVSDR